MSSPSVPPAARASVGSALYYSAVVGIPTTEVKGRSSLKPAVRAAGWLGTPPNSTADGPPSPSIGDGLSAGKYVAWLAIAVRRFGRATTGQNGAKSGLATCNWKWAKTQ